MGHTNQGLFYPGENRTSSATAQKFVLGSSKTIQVTLVDYDSGFLDNLWTLGVVDSVLLGWALYREEQVACNNALLHTYLPWVESAFSVHFDDGNSVAVQ